MKNHLYAVLMAVKKGFDNEANEVFINEKLIIKIFFAVNVRATSVMMIVTSIS